VADVTAKWALDIDANAGSAKDAAQTLEHFRDKVREDSAALTDLRKAMSNIKGTTVGTKEEIARMKDAALALRTRIAQNQKGFTDLGGNLKDLFRPQTRKATEDTGALKEALLRAIPGAQRAWGALSAVKLSTLGMAAAAVSAVAAVVGLAVGFGVATIKAIQFAMAEANVARNQRLALEQMILYDQLAGRVSGLKDATVYAGQFDRALVELAADVPQTRDELAGMAQELWTMRLRGTQLQEALKASAMVGGVQKFLALGYSAQGTGRSIHQLAQIVEKQFGANLAKRMLSLDVQTRKMKENFRGLFRDLNLETFVRPLKEFTDLFSQNTVTGQALKTIVEGIFDPLIKGSGIVSAMVKPVFQGLVIAALVLVIAVLRVRNAIRDAFPDSTLAKIDAHKVALTVASVTLAAISTAAIFAGVAIGALGLAVASLVLPFIAAHQAFKWLLAMDTRSIGNDLIRGLVEGLQSGAKWVVREVQELGAKIKGALNSALGIHSPSTFGINVMHQLSAGMVLGGRQKRGEVEGAGEDMAMAAAGGMAFPASTTAAAAAAGPSLVVNLGGFHYHGPADLPPDFEARVEDSLETIFERLNRKMGFA
jgi:hypothetical protein